MVSATTLCLASGASLTVLPQRHHCKASFCLYKYVSFDETKVKLCHVIRIVEFQNIKMCKSFPVSLQCERSEFLIS